MRREEKRREERRREDKRREEKRREEKRREEKRREEENKGTPAIVKFLMRKVLAISECNKPRRTEDTQNQT